MGIWGRPRLTHVVQRDSLFVSFPQKDDESAHPLRTSVSSDSTPPLRVPPAVLHGRAFHLAGILCDVEAGLTRLGSWLGLGPWLWPWTAREK